MTSSPTRPLPPDLPLVRPPARPLPLRQRLRLRLRPPLAVPLARRVPPGLAVTLALGALVVWGCGLKQPADPGAPRPAARLSVSAAAGGRAEWALVPVDTLAPNPAPAGLAVAADAAGGAAWPNPPLTLAPVAASLYPWPLGRRAAVSLTFDDAYPSHVGLGMPLLEARGFRGTFYLITDRLMRLGKYRYAETAPLVTWKTGARHGHELASHSCSHQPLDSLTAIDIERELRLSRELLEDLFPGLSVASLAYPFSQADSHTVAVARGIYRSGRLGPPQAGQDVYNDPATADLMTLRSLNLCSGEAASMWGERVAAAEAAGGWLIENLHALEDDEGYCRVHRSVLEDHLDDLARRPGVWVAPVGTVAARLEAWRSACVVTAVQAADQIELQLAGQGWAGVDWQVRVNLDEPAGWVVEDRRGRRYPSQAEPGSLRFLWPARAGQRLVLRHGGLAAATPGAAYAAQEPR